MGRVIAHQHCLFNLHFVCRLAPAAGNVTTAANEFQLETMGA
jgi:hypothetical protein